MFSAHFYDEFVEPDEPFLAVDGQFLGDVGPPPDGQLFPFHESAAPVLRSLERAVFVFGQFLGFQSNVGCGDNNASLSGLSDPVYQLGL